jgi:hypothetical protein
MSVYHHCSKCGSLKEMNKNSYCKKCSKVYFKNWRINKAKSKNISHKELSTFIDKVIENEYNVEFGDLNEIINFYSDITDNIDELNDYPVNEQIVEMWNKIYKYYKDNIVQKNI